MNDFTIIMTITLYCIIVIPLSGYLSNILTTFAVSKGLVTRQTMLIPIAVMIAIPVIFVVNDYKEKDLNEVISFNIDKVDYVQIDHRLRTDELEDAKTLSELLSQYRVKKMKDREWNSDVSKEKGYTITIYPKDSNPIIASIYEDRLHTNDGDYYEVVNGPIDMSWFDKLYDQY
ncbi:hypothetical protein [Lentibacillus saliphilus]|uniref:hypothetical protein n=1 Tax=Lentibacillus saliphilus TaxID=2737028 RepID=UPI001C2F7AFF|nr:hypothetical protein [Lentibacillus saliphilus]